MEQLRPKDVVVIWKLDRLARTLKDLINLVNEIQDLSLGNTNGGTFTLMINGSAPSGPISFNANAQDVVQALSDLTRRGYEIDTAATIVTDTIQLYTAARNAGWDVPIVSNMVVMHPLIAEAADGNAEVEWGACDANS